MTTIETNQARFEDRLKNLEKDFHRTLAKMTDPEVIAEMAEKAGKLRELARKREELDRQMEEMRAALQL